MFTGLIEEIGIVKKILSVGGGLKLLISAEKILEDSRIGDSICINGVCLTITEFSRSTFWVDAVGATLLKSTLSKITIGTKVNLERAIRADSRLGGHIVQGHVNGIGKILQIKRHEENYLLKISTENNLFRYIIDEGSIAIDGISLTVSKIYSDAVFDISVIPHTWKYTNLQYRKIGENVNIEIDILIKYVENQFMSNSTVNKFSEKWFKELGY
ncbi:MAG: riboflavin synthase [Bacteroidota bacterium]